MEVLASVVVVLVEPVEVVLVEVGEAVLVSVVEASVVVLASVVGLVVVRVVVSSPGHTQGGEEQPQGSSIPAHLFADFPLHNQYSCTSSKVASFCDTPVIASNCLYVLLNFSLYALVILFSHFVGI